MLYVLVVLLGVGARTAAAAQGWLYWDDLILQSKARLSTLTSLPLTLHDSHLMPGAWLIEWVLAHLVPLNWPAALGVLAALQLLAASAVAFACRTVSPRYGVVALGFYLLTPLTLPVTTWLAAGVNALPLHASIALVFAFSLRYLRSGAHRDLLWAAAWLLFGLVFNERALLVAPVVLFMLVCFGESRRGDKAKLGRLAGVLAVPAAAWGLLYVALLVRDGTGAEVAGERPSLLGLLYRGYVHALAPIAAGGPWEWDRWHPGPPFATPGTTVIVLGVAVTAAVVWLNPRAWLPPLAYPLAPIMGLYVVRSSGDTALEIVQTLRHLSEVAVIAAVTLAFVLENRKREKTGGILLRRAGAVCAVVWVLGASISSVSYARVWAEQPAREYFHNAAGGPRVLDQEVPLEVLLPVAHPHNMLGNLAPWLVTDHTERPMLIDAHGHHQPATLHTQRRGGSTCGTEVRLDGPLIDWDWTVRVSYEASEATTVEIALDGEPVTVPVDSGRGEVWVRVKGGGQSVHILGGHGSVCASAEVGMLSS